ncbi:hypothetical protein AYI68_g5826, partial [Smittium mucronatum]
MLCEHVAVIANNFYGFCQLVDRIMGLPDYRVRLCDTYGRTYFYLFMSYLFTWVTKFFVLLVCGSLAVQGYWFFNDKSVYSIPGTLVSVTAVGTNSRYNIHVYCMGTNFPGNTFILFSDFGLPGLSLIDLMSSIYDLGHPACIVDRPGYGYSDPGYWPQNPNNLIQEIDSALSDYPVKKPYILVGHGDGGLYAQLYVQSFRSSVAGVALLNVLPNRQLFDYVALNNTEVLQNLKQFSQSNPSVYRSLEKSTSAYYESWRAFSPLGYTRSKNPTPDYTYLEKTKSILKTLFNTNTYYQASYFEYGFTGNNLYGSLYAQVSKETNTYISGFNGWPFRWPSFGNGTYNYNKRQDTNSTITTIINGVAVTTFNATATTTVSGNGSTGSASDSNSSSGSNSGSSSNSTSSSDSSSNSSSSSGA